MRSTLIRAAGFVAVFVALQSLWQFNSDSAPGRWLIERGVVAPAGRLIQMLSPDLPLQVVDRRLRSPGVTLVIVNGCDGTETLFLLLAGLAVAPMPMRRRLTAMLISVPLVYALNQARILALFYAERRGAAEFDLWHAWLTPLLMVIVIVAYFYAWLRGAKSWTRDGA